MGRPMDGGAPYAGRPARGAGASRANRRRRPRPAPSPTTAARPGRRGAVTDLPTAPPLGGEPENLADGTHGQSPSGHGRLLGTRLLPGTLVPVSMPRRRPQPLSLP